MLGAPGLGFRVMKCDLPDREPTRQGTMSRNKASIPSTSSLSRHVSDWGASFGPLTVGCGCSRVWSAARSRLLRRRRQRRCVLRNQPSMRGCVGAAGEGTREWTRRHRFLEPPHQCRHWRVLFLPSMKFWAKERKACSLFVIFLVPNVQSR